MDEVIRLLIILK